MHITHQHSHTLHHTSPQILVECGTTGGRWLFDCHRWLCLDTGDGRIERELHPPVEGEEEGVGSGSGTPAHRFFTSLKSHEAVRIGHWLWRISKLTCAHAHKHLNCELTHQKTYMYWTPWTQILVELFSNIYCQNCYPNLVLFPLPGYAMNFELWTLAMLHSC